MTPEELLSAFESASTRRQAERILGNTDISEAFFFRVAALSGQDPRACIRLARRAAWMPTSQLGYVYRAKAVGARAAGKWQLAADFFFQAANHCKGNDKWAFSIGAIDSLARAGKPAEAVEYGLKAIRGIKNDDHLKARARLNVANALVWQDRNSEAAQEYARALNLLPPHATLEQASASLGLSTAALLGDDPLAARDAAERAAQLFDSEEMTYHANLARLNLAQADLQLGRPDDAVRQFLELVPAFDDSPPDVVRIQEFLGDCYLRLNLSSEAESAYRTALRSTAIEEMPLNLANCRFGLARLLERKSPKESQRLYRLAARSYGQVDNRPWELAASGRAVPSGVSKAVAELTALKARYLTEDLAIWGAEAGVLVIPAKPKSPPLEWRYALLIARQKPTRANYRKVFELIERDRQAIRTPSAALRFFDDRGAAVNEYLELLIDAGDVAGAIDVITRSRSAALIDEIVASRGQQLSPKALNELSILRYAYGADQAPGSRLRNDLHAVTPRQWTEYTWDLRAATDAARPARKAADGDVWLDTGERMYRLRGETSAKMPFTTHDLARKLDWLEFYLFEPMIDPAADWNCPGEAITELAAAIDTPKGTVCPDGVLWRAPWTLLSEGEVTLVLNPADMMGEVRMPESPRVAVWAAHAVDLPSIDEEIDAVLAAFPNADVLTTRAEVRASYGQEYDLIHVAGHARINPESPALSYIDFGDGPLHATEIARSGLRVKLAIVAACRSGMALSHQRFEPEGIVRSFLACGAEAAVGSLWPLDDRFTASFMRALYPQLAYRETLLTAMSSARRHCREHFPHPYYWGSLATFGGYRNL